MTENKRYSHDAIVIVDHLKKDLIYIDGKDDLLELAEYVDRLQDENEQLKEEKQLLYKNFDEYKYITRLEKENQILKNEIVTIVGLCVKMEDYIDDIKIIANNRGGKND